MLEFILALKTNELLITFVLNNVVLLWFIKNVSGYIAKKTPWGWDNDIAPFFGGLIDGIKGFKNNNKNINE